MKKKLFYRYENESVDSNDFKLQEKLLYNAGRNCFILKEEADVHFTESHEIALKKYENIMNGIGKLKELLGYFRYDYFVLGDTYGIEQEGMYIEFEVNGYWFKFPA